MVEAAITRSESLNALLNLHPFVRVGVDSGSGALQFDEGTWRREISINNFDMECRGLVELMDNNPMVCADRVSLPGPVETLALIALGPLAKAQLIVEEPIVMANVPVAEACLSQWVVEAGWAGGVSAAVDEIELEGVVAVTVLCKIETPALLDSIDDLYDECFGRSFFIRREEEAEWDVALVKQQPYAVYRLGISEGEPHSLLRIQVMADREGKCGSAQIIHAMNVMSGFEESLPFA